MDARVTHASFPADRLDESKQVVADQMKEIRANEGNRGYLLLTDPGTGASMVSLWEDDAAMRASEQQADRVRDGVARPTTASISGVDRFAVAIADLNSWAARSSTSRDRRPWVPWVAVQYRTELEALAEPARSTVE